MKYTRMKITIKLLFIKKIFWISVKKVFTNGLRIDELRKLSSHPTTFVKHTVGNAPIYINI